MTTKTVKPDPEGPSSGRIAFDDRGNAVWQWRSDTGTYKSDIDTRQVRALQEATTAQLGGDPQAPAPTARPGNDPYSTADSHHLLPKKAPRRTLDDMRKLSDEIKRNRQK